MLSAAADTPIHRASINEMTADEIEKLVEQMRERRMRAYTAYQQLMEEKAKIKEERDKARYDKVLGMLEKKLAAAEKALDDASKYSNELKVLALVLGE